jgi:hypothetical protein
LKNKTILVLWGIIALLSIYITWTTYDYKQIKKEMDMIKYEIIRIHDEVISIQEKEISLNRKEFKSL